MCRIQNLLVMMLVLLGLGLSHAAWALPLEKYQQLSKSPQSQTQLKAHLVGVRDGLMAYNRSLPSFKQSPLFCLPPAMTLLTVDEFKAIIDSELQLQAANGNALPPQGNMEPAGLLGLVRRYPCGKASPQ